MLHYNDCLLHMDIPLEQSAEFLQQPTEAECKKGSPRKFF